MIILYPTHKLCYNIHMRNRLQGNISTTNSLYKAIQPQPAHIILGIGILIYSLAALVSTPITFMIALMGQIYDGPNKPLSVQILQIVVLLLPISSIVSGIIGLLISISIFKQTKVPKMHYVLLILFSIPLILLLLEILLIIILNIPNYS